MFYFFIYLLTYLLLLQTAALDLCGQAEKLSAYTRGITIRVNMYDLVSLQLPEILKGLKFQGCSLI